MRLLGRLAVPAVALLAFVVGSSSEAAFTLNVTNASTPLVYTAGGTTLTLSPNSNQTFQGSSNANVFSVMATSTTTAPNYDTGSFMFTETITLQTVGSSTSASFNFTGTLVLTQGSTGAILSNVTNTSITALGGMTGGFTVSFAGYAAPSPSSAGSAGTTGNISLQILAPSAVSPAVVPEPASIVMLGLGLVGTIGVAARRRLA